MEFERAIYRVYERCLESLREDNDEGSENVNMKTCRIIEILSLMVGLFLLLCLVYLHVAFVGKGGCLGRTLSVLNIEEFINSSVGGFNVNSSYPFTSALELRTDQLLAIKIDRGSPYSDKSQSSTNRLRSTKMNSVTDDGLSSSAKRMRKVEIVQSPLTNSVQEAVQNISHVNSSSPNLTNQARSSVPALDYDYMFAFDAYVLLLSDEVKINHKFPVINVTLSGSKCFGGLITQNLLPMAGLDAIVMNSLMYTFRKTGYLISQDRQSFYRWSEDTIDPYKVTVRQPTAAALLYAKFSTWIQIKVGILFNSLFAFFLLSSVTALLVRMLISSGVVLLFPIFWIFQLFGMHAINLRIISLSYPWIGLPMEILRTRSQPTTPFVLAHISRVVIYYCLYAAAQVAFSSWFYDENAPSQQELWLCAVMMIWEYYSMIYVRASLSIQLFPRASLALFLIYHFYYFSYPSGLHLLALTVMSFFLLFLMIFCVRVFETKAFQRGAVSLDQPR